MRTSSFMNALMLWTQTGKLTWTEVSGFESKGGVGRACKKAFQGGRGYLKKHKWGKGKIERNSEIKFQIAGATYF